MKKLVKATLKVRFLQSTSLFLMLFLVAYLIAPVSGQRLRNCGGKYDRCIVCYENSVFDADPAKLNVAIYLLPIDTLAILAAAFRIVQNTRNKI
jgi:hypothetical protein